jgi:hypothetical protein
MAARTHAFVRWHYAMGMNNPITSAPIDLRSSYPPSQIYRVPCA